MQNNLPTPHNSAKSLNTVKTIFHDIPIPFPFRNKISLSLSPIILKFINHQLTVTV